MRVDMRDEDGQVVDGWIVVMARAAYLFHSDNTAFDAVCNANARYREDGLYRVKADNEPKAMFRHAYVGERRRSELVERTVEYEN